jgi:serine/threonine-protein kinase
MATPEERLLAPLRSTPALPGSASGGLAHMPADLLEQTCRRVGIASLVFAGIWAWSLAMSNLAWRFFGPQPPHVGEWNLIGNPLSVIGLGLSLGMVFVAGRLHHRPGILLDVGLAFEVATCALIGAANWWFPVQNGFGVSWICIVLILYPAIVPARIAKVLAASLIAASMDPIWYWIGIQRGLEYGLGGYQLLWAFLPNYVCAFLAIVPAKVIRGLGRRVSAARELGAYQIGELLGRGGMGDVYRATHRLLARPAAIKLVRAEALGAADDSAAVVLERFRREAHAAANLRSPHTIELYDFGASEDGHLYYVMELLEGLDLQELVSRYGPVPAARAVHLLKQACMSLAEAHDRGLVHRDIKPSNLVACRLGAAVDFLKVLDFGLVKMNAPEDGPRADLTSPNVTTGTPAFMAPELALGDRPVDGRTDLYALGCVGYWLLTGRTPFEATTPVAMLMKHVQESPRPPSQLSELPVPTELDAVLLDCLAKDPDARPADAAELYRRLSDCPLPDPWSRDRAVQWWELHLPEVKTDLGESDMISVPAGSPGTLLRRAGAAPDR